MTKATKPGAKRQCTQCGIRRTEDKFTGPRGRLCTICRKKNTKATARATHLKKYGITPEEYDELAKDGCQICGGARPYNIPVDHDHAIEAQFGVRASVRGAICKRCNKLLRDVRDDDQLLIAAAAYLRNPPAKKVLFP